MKEKIRITYEKNNELPDLTSLVKELDSYSKFLYENESITLLEKEEDKSNIYLTILFEAEEISDIDILLNEITQDRDPITDII